MTALTKYIHSTTYKNILLKYLHVSQYSFQHKSPISIQSERVESITFSTLTAQIPGGGVLPIMAYTGRLRPKGVPFSGFRYKKG